MTVRRTRSSRRIPFDIAEADAGSDERRFLEQAVRPGIAAIALKQRADDKQRDNRNQKIDYRRDARSLCAVQDVQCGRDRTPLRPMPSPPSVRGRRCTENPYRTESVRQFRGRPTRADEILRGVGDLAGQRPGCDAGRAEPRKRSEALS